MKFLGLYILITLNLNAEDFKPNHLLFAGVHIAIYFSTAHIVPKISYLPTNISFFSIVLCYSGDKEHSKDLRQDFMKSLGINSS